MVKRFDKKIVLVTGAASGIGRATALAFAAEGAQLVLCDVDVAAVGETTAMARELGAPAEFIRCDVARASDCEAMVARAVDAFGGWMWHSTMPGSTSLRRPLGTSKKWNGSASSPPISQGSFTA